MMKLYPKDYKMVKEEVVLFSEDRITKALGLIKAFVADEPKYDTDIIDYIKKEMGLSGLPDVRDLIAEVDKEWHPPVEEEELIEEPVKPKKKK